MRICEVSVFAETTTEEAFDFPEKKNKLIINGRNILFLPVFNKLTANFIIELSILFFTPAFFKEKH